MKSESHILRHWMLFVLRLLWFLSQAAPRLQPPHFKKHMRAALKSYPYCLVHRSLITPGYDMPNIKYEDLREPNSIDFTQIRKKSHSG